MPIDDTHTMEVVLRGFDVVICHIAGVLLNDDRHTVDQRFRLDEMAVDEQRMVRGQTQIAFRQAGAKSAGEDADRPHFFRHGMAGEVDSPLPNPNDFGNALVSGARGEHLVTRNDLFH